MAKNTLKILASLFIFIGILLTLENYNLIPNISKNWPIILTIFGLGFILLFYNRKKTDPALIWLGSFLFELSLFFYYLNFTTWKNLTYLWTIFLCLIGISFLATGIATKKKVYDYLATLFIFIFLGLYLVFTISLKIWPISLVIFGLSLLIIEHFSNKKVTKRVKR